MTVAYNPLSAELAYEPLYISVCLQDHKMLPALSRYCVSIRSPVINKLLGVIYALSLGSPGSSCPVNSVPLFAGGGIDAQIHLLDLQALRFFQFSLGIFEDMKTVIVCSRHLGFLYSCFKAVE